MTKEFWKAPSFGLSLKEIDDVEIFRIPERKIISEEGWPTSFLCQINDRFALDGEESKNIVSLFLGLIVDEPYRCHMPPWGLAFYRDKELISTVTLCFECSNAYVYTIEGKNLRAFDISQDCSVKLLELFKKYLPI